MSPAAARGALLPLLLLPVLAAPLPAADDEAAIEETVARVAALRREIEALLEGLPPELRAEVERRLAGPAEEAPAAAPVAATEALPPALTGLPVAEPAPAEPTPVPPDRCDTLGFLDTSGDGLVSAIDRHWRFLHLWLDDGDGELEAGETERLFEAGVHSLDVRLHAFTARNGDSGDLRLGERVVLGPLGRAGGEGALAIDADGVARGGQLRLTDAAGSDLTGLQPLTRALRIELPDGTLFSPLCG